MFKFADREINKMKPVENLDTDNLRVNLLTQEIKFAKMLAGNEFDGAIKEKHIDKLAMWLKNRTSCTEGIAFKHNIFHIATKIFMKFLCGFFFGRAFSFNRVYG